MALTHPSYELIVSPMKCPKCNFEQPDLNLECMRCGIIFEKYRNRLQAASRPVSNSIEAEVDDESPPSFIKDLLFYVNPQINPLIFWGRVLFFAVIFFWGLKFIFTPMESNYVFKSFWHLVDLPFHEFGHIIFRPFGRFMTSLGGQPGTGFDAADMSGCISDQNPGYLCRFLLPVVGW